MCNVVHHPLWNVVHSLLKRWLQCPFAQPITHWDVLNGAWVGPVQYFSTWISLIWINESFGCVWLCVAWVKKKKIAYLHVCLFVWCVYANAWVCGWRLCMCVCPPYTKLDSSRAKMTKWVSPQPVFSSISLLISFSFPPILYLNKQHEKAFEKCQSIDEIDDCCNRFWHFQSKWKCQNLVGKLNLWHRSFTLSSNIHWIFIHNPLQKETKGFNFWYMEKPCSLSSVNISVLMQNLLPRFPFDKYKISLGAS